MSDSLQIYLPAELVHAIIVRMEDRDADYRPLKRGLASCSLTCRRWAAIIRPALFHQLTLRSAEDVSQLIALLRVPDFMGCALGDCIRWLEVVDDSASAPGTIPWSHQILRLDRQLPSVSIALTIEGAPADGLKCSSSLLFSLLPRSLPVSAMALSQLTLSDLRLQSVQTLLDMVEYLRVTDIRLYAITFVEGNLGHVRHRRSPPRLHNSRLTVSRCFPDPANLQRWVVISNILLARRASRPLNIATQVLIERYVHLLLSCTRDEDHVEKLEVDIFEST